MSFAPNDQSDDASSDLAPASPESVGSPPAVAVTPVSPEQASRENARNGRWSMNEHFSGWVLLGADDKPVMRNDGSRVGFFFHDMARLEADLAAEPAQGGLPAELVLPEGEDEAASRAKAWQADRRALAPLDSGLNADWDPQRPWSQLADKTKWTKLLAYYYAQTTEPEEAVRRAVSPSSSAIQSLTSLARSSGCRRSTTRKTWNLSPRAFCLKCLGRNDQKRAMSRHRDGRQPIPILVRTS